MSDVAQAIADALISEDVSAINGGNANVVDVLAMIAFQLKRMGNFDADTRMGAIEAHGKIIADALKAGLHEIAEAIREMPA